MKKIICCFFITAALMACNEQNTDPVVAEKEVVSKPAEQIAETAPANPLIAKYDCEGCHRIDEKLNGPSYIDIAEKYAGKSAAVNELALKIIKGGSGVWGNIPMNAHPNMPKGDAEELVKYILSLKK